MDSNDVFKKTHVGKKWHSKQADHKVLLNEECFQESMYNTELSVAEPNGADASEGTCKLPVFFFDGMNKTTQQPDYVDSLIVRLRKKIFPRCPKGSREIDGIPVLIFGIMMMLVIVIGSFISKKYTEVVNDQCCIYLL